MNSDLHPPTIHATAVEWNGFGILLRGASGSGKSSIALQMLDEANASSFPCFLIADDRVCLTPQQDTIIASSPARLEGLIEMRGIGIVKMPAKNSCRLDLIVDLVSASTIARFPDEQAKFSILVGHQIRTISIAQRNPHASVFIRTSLNFPAL